MTNRLLGENFILEIKVSEQRRKIKLGMKGWKVLARIVPNKTVRLTFAATITAQKCRAQTGFFGRHLQLITDNQFQF